MFINIHIYSKNKLSILNYLKFLKKYLRKKKLKFKNIIIMFKKKTKTKVFTVLKSPHVNKTAQTQFEQRLYKNQLTVYSSNYLKLIYFIKYFSEKNFSDVKLKIKIIKNKNNNFILKKTTSFLNNSELQSTSFLKILDSIGEVNFKKISLGSSVGRAKD